VKVGSGLVDESGKTLSEIMESVKKVTDIVPRSPRRAKSSRRASSR
jgi:hypothetical protein